MVKAQNTEQDTMKPFIHRDIFRSLLTLILISTLGSSLAFAEVTAYLNQKSVYLGDIITLRVETNKNEAATPDLSGLEKNFDVKSTSVNSAINLINGRGSFRKVWAIELQAKSIGEFTIPEITLGNEKTQKISLVVNELPPEITAENNKHVFLEATVDIQNDEIYVQQQIPYTIKFYYDASMSGGEFITPTIEDANMTVVGPDNRYRAVREGNEFIVVEKRFLISPEKSGKLLIPPTKVQGRLQLTGDIAPSPSHSRPKSDIDRFNDIFANMNNGSIFSNRFDPFKAQQQAPTRPFTISSESFNVNVLPVPATFTGTSWLPAEEIIMQDSWTQRPPELKVGEPVTRTIVMQVKGLASSQIPDIDIPEAEGMKVYPEKAESETPNDGSTIYGLQRVEITYIPEKQGEIVIPKIDIDWWDVNKKKQQTYTLPQLELSVAAGADGVQNVDEINSESQKIGNEIIPKKEEISKNEPETVNNWHWETILGTVVLVILFVFLLVYFIKYYLSSSFYARKNQQRKNRFEEQRLRKELLEACIKNDNKTASNLLIKHAATTFNDPKLQSLGALAKKLKNGSDIVKQLELSLYSNEKKSWDGAGLHKLVSVGLQADTIQQEMHKGLAPLYPN